MGSVFAEPGTSRRTEGLSDTSTEDSEDDEAFREERD